MQLTYELHRVPARLGFSKDSGVKLNDFKLPFRRNAAVKSKVQVEGGPPLVTAANKVRYQAAISKAITKLKTGGIPNGRR